MMQKIFKNGFRSFLVICIAFGMFTVISSCDKDDDDDVRMRVYIDNTIFNPSVVIIPVGGTVIWENDDNVTHTVTGDSSFFDSGDLAPDQTFSHTFTEAGTYSYHCEHHSSMTGSVTVE